MKYLRYINESDNYIKVFNYKVEYIESIDNLSKYKTHRRLRVFYEKGLSCSVPTCDIKGTIIVHSTDKKGNKHIDICDDNLYPLTIDHILPRSKGGSDSITNLRPMCCTCNFKRGNDDDIIDNSDRKDSKISYDINIGDIVYKKVSNEKLGEVIDIVINDRHPKKEISCVIKERHPSSLFSIKSLYKKI